jgi:CRP-like cAMP-binding protein
MIGAMAGDAATIDLLRRVPLFEDLDSDELGVVAEALEERAFAAGDTVVEEGGAADWFFVVVGGEADVSVGGVPQGRVGPGDHVGEIGLLMGAERTATVVAATDLRCLGLTPADFRAVVEGNPTIAWKLLESMTLRLG